MGYNIAIVGASGMVGKKILEVLTERVPDIDNLYMFSSKRSAGKSVKINKKKYKYIELSAENIENKDIHFALFSAGGAISKEYAPIFAKSGTVVIDNSSCFRMEEGVPLVVPEVNPEALDTHNNIISNPNCSTIQAVVAIAPLHKKYKIKRIIFSTYQAVSGAGQKGYNDLKEGIKGKKAKHFPCPIFSNVIPQIDSFLEDGYTKEEYKMINEVKKILNDYDIKITATTVRVPVFNGHSESINIEFEENIDIVEVKEVLEKSEGIVVSDDVCKGLYPTPFMVDNRDEVFVGRIRRDDSVENGINLWVVADNIRKGAATNAVQILQLLIDKEQNGKVISR